MNADETQRTCPKCRQSFERETIAGLASWWCPRCALLCATADELEAVARALRAEGDDARLPAGHGDPVNVSQPCATCGGKLYLQDHHAWATCGGCQRIYVPKSELRVLVDDPGLARRRPLDMPFELTAKDRAKDRTAFSVLGVLSVLAAVACFVVAADTWQAQPKDWDVVPAYRGTDPELPFELFAFGLVLLGTAAGLFFKVLHPHSYWQKEAGPTDEYEGHGRTGPMV